MSQRNAMAATCAASVMRFVSRSSGVARRLAAGFFVAERRAVLCFGRHSLHAAHGSSV